MKSSASNSINPSQNVSATSSVWKRKIEDVCSEFQLFMGSQGDSFSVQTVSEPEKRTLSECIPLMQTLMKQYMEQCTFMNTPVWASMDPEQQAFFTDEQRNTQLQIKELQAEMTELADHSKRVAAEGVVVGVSAPPPGYHGVGGAGGAAGGALCAPCAALNMSQV